jgi:hypothetical protein
MVFTKTRLQKIAIIVLLAIAGILLISSLGFVETSWNKMYYSKENLATNGSNNFYGQILRYTSQVWTGKRNPEAASFYYKIWDDIQAANNMIFYTAIWAFVFIAVACIAGNFSRRKFYISNLVCGLLYSVVTIAMSIMGIVKIATVKSDFAIAKPDFIWYYQRQVQEDIEWGTNNAQIIEANNLGLYYFLLVLVIIAAIAFAVVTILKFRKTYPGKLNKVEKEESAEQNVEADVDVTENSKEVATNE